MLDKVDPWFVQILATALAGYFLWSVQKILRDFKDQVKELKETLRKLFDRGDDHEHRLSHLEGRCDAMHGKAPGGRRDYDPEDRPHD